AGGGGAFEDPGAGVGKLEMRVAQGDGEDLPRLENLLVEALLDGVPELCAALAEDGAGVGVGQGLRVRSHAHYCASFGNIVGKLEQKTSKRIRRKHDSSYIG